MLVKLRLGGAKSNGEVVVIESGVDDGVPMLFEVRRFDATGDRMPTVEEEDGHGFLAVAFFHGHCRSLPCRCRLVHHVSLEDPLMRAFSGEWVEGVLKSLGMPEDEAIESKMVARPIKAAQQKLAGQCMTDFSADSAEKWIERNRSGEWPKN